LSELRLFPSPLAKARLSASNFCAAHLYAKLKSLKRVAAATQNIDQKITQDNSVSFQIIWRRFFHDIWRSGAARPRSSRSQ
jgi:hypothetical protein